MTTLLDMKIHDIHHYTNQINSDQSNEIPNIIIWMWVYLSGNNIKFQELVPKEYQKIIRENCDQIIHLKNKLIPYESLNEFIRVITIYNPQDLQKIKEFIKLSVI